MKNAKIYLCNVNNKYNVNIWHQNLGWVQDFYGGSIGLVYLKTPTMID